MIEEETKPQKITLQRRTQSTLKTTGAAGRGRTVSVEVRKKRTYMRRGGTDDEGEQDEVNAPKPARRKVNDADAEVEQKRQETVRHIAEQAEQVEKEQAEKERAEKEQTEKERAEKEQSEKEQAEKEQGEAGQQRKEEAPTRAEELETLAQPDVGVEENKVSSRKDKRDRRDLDEDDIQKKKSHGNRKRRVQELIGEDLLGEDDIEEEDIKGEDIKEKDIKEKDIKGKDIKGKDIKGKDIKGKDIKGKDIAGKDVQLSGNQVDAATLGLSSPRARRSSADRPAKRHKFNAPTEKIKREVELGESITIQQLSRKTSIKATDIIRTLFNLGVSKTIHEAIDQETAQLVVEELGHQVKLLDADAVEKTLEEELVYDVEETPRAPVVTVMGHVDHGKTSLLDFIRSSGVASGEAGGITQHIGAYRVSTDQGEICFIDTPGHAAFTAMRARGANATDIVILVVAADDGVMPQTEEAIQHAQGAEAPVIVAINKMDKEGADPERVKNELAARDVIPEDWGGDVQFVPCSAVTGEGIDNLLEAVLLQAELMELSAVENGPAQGIVIESELDRNKGPIATLLVQQGTLKQGNVIVAGQHFGRVRALNDENGKQVKSAGPATPVAVLGLNGTPDAGESFILARDERRAREVAEFRSTRANEVRLNVGTSLDNLFDSLGGEEVKQLNVVVKADVRGSLEAIVSALNKVGNEEVRVNVVMQGVGAITESDATYAVTAGAVIFGFNVRADNAAKKVVESEGLDLRYYKVIYDLVDDVEAALSGMLTPEVREDIVGIAEVREVFRSRKMGQVAGCMVLEGTIYRAKNIRVLRDNVVIYEGELESLRHFKDEVENVSSGTECGIGVKNYNDVKTGDLVEVFDSREVARTLASSR